MARFVMLAVAVLLALVAVGCGSDAVTQSSPGRDWPEEHRWRINDEVEALFAYKAPLADWNAAIFMDHLPTKTWVSLTADARISDHKGAGRDAMIAVCALLTGGSVVDELRAEAAERDPYPAFIAHALGDDPCDLY
ncbi:hypothetical protein H8E07_01190 [bacterium]|nr:hypothetical protein [bacterium]